jgi:hypothetical protein
VGTPLENIIAMYKTAGSLSEVNDSILSIETEKNDEEVNMSRLF